MTSTDRPPSPWWRHDLIVVAIGAALLVAGSIAYRVVTAPRTTVFHRRGLRFERPAAMLPPQDVIEATSALGALGTGGDDLTGNEPAELHQVFQSLDDPRNRLEILIQGRPDYRSLPSWLRLARHTRYGEFYWTDSSTPVRVHGRDWQRTRFKYAFKATSDDAPLIATGIEYASLNEGLLYVVTAHGTEGGASRLEQIALRSLEVTPPAP